MLGNGLWLQAACCVTKQDLAILDAVNFFVVAGSS